MYSPIFKCQAVQEDCQEQMDALLYKGWHVWCLVLSESKGANQVTGVCSSHCDVGVNEKRSATE